jgi:alpha 1,3-glucosidase
MDTPQELDDMFLIKLSLRSAAEKSANYMARFEMSKKYATIRLMIDEVPHDGIHSRYHVPTIASQLKRNLVSDRIDSGTSILKSDHDSNKSKFAISGLFEVELSHSPFVVRVYNRLGELIQVVNSNNMFTFEKYRSNFGDMCPRDTSKDMACNTDFDGQGLWEEDFAGFKDHKRYGPSSVGIDIDLVDSVNVFGLPEHTLPFNLPTDGEEIRFFNADVYHHSLHSPAALYGSVPILQSVHASGSVSGILWQNPSETYVSLTRPSVNIVSSWISETGVIDIVLLTGPTPMDVMTQFHAITDLPTLPPIFALGFHQSKWGYENEDAVAAVNEGFTSHNIPLDVLWLDIQHTDGNRYFTWGPGYTHPESLTEKLGTEGRKLVAIIDPHIKVDESYSVYKSASDKNLFVKDTDGKTNFQGNCWPGTSSYLDFSRTDVRDYWKSLFKYDQYKGSSPRLFVWNDMNEPSVFDSAESTLPRSAVHGGEIEHRELHNLYGMFYHGSTYEALLARDGDDPKRPFVLSRSFFAGSHRYGPIWTGDNMSTWNFLRASVPMLLSLSLGGLSFTGADVGGFDGHPNKELFVRWHQLAAMAYPFYRCHSTHESPRREPWTYDEEALNIVKSAIQTRYQLLPYWYTLFAKHAMTGAPIIRPLWFDHISDMNTVTDLLATEEQIMLGDSVLVRGVYEESAQSVDVYLPGQDTIWYDFNDPQTPAQAGGRRISVATFLHSIPVYVKGGSIIPVKLEARKSSELMRTDPVSLRIYVNNARASGTLYIDDEESMRYQSHRDFAMISLSFENGVLTCEQTDGDRKLTTLVLDRVDLIGTDHSIQVQRRGLCEPDITRRIRRHDQ